MAAIWFLAAVTMQRAWVVLCISKGKQNRITKAGTMMVTMGIWVAALATSIAPLLGWNNYVYEVKTRKKIFIFGLRNQSRRRNTDGLLAHRRATSFEAQIDHF